MDSDELRDVLDGEFLAKGDSRLSISSHLLRRVEPGETVVAVGGEHSAGAQLNAVADALHLWIKQAERQGAIRLVLGTSAKKPPQSQRTLQAVATLARALSDEVDLRIEVDHGQPGAPAPDFARARPEWRKALEDQDERASDPPPLARQLSELVNDTSFRWYVTLHDHRFQGRIDGLTVCVLDRSDQAGSLDVGKPVQKGDSRARRRFGKLLECGWFNFSASDQSSVDEAADIIRKLAQDRHSGELAEVDREHRLESRVLRGDIALRLDDGRTLQPVLTNGQFPTLWATTDGAKARYLDVLAGHGRQPWAVELKGQWGGGSGQYLRHAVGQVVLYREFIRGAHELHPWFAEPEPPLVPQDCQAAVAFPRPSGRTPEAAKRRLDDVRAIAELFDVEVIELDEGETSGE